ncbi:MAG: YdeI/OmpD-associated family protein [Dehalococcoidia bacterium]|jgi:uncharacterized protein YdeI (YjbR/CyaY-like superfamily)
MELGETLDVATREEWREWLARNHHKAKEIWLVYHRKASSRSRISYNEAVEEALCYGWIDSTVKNVDGNSFAQRFTPRNPTAPVSEMNKERVRRLLADGKMTPAGLAVIGDVESRLDIPADVLAELQEDERTWANFQQFPEPYRIIRIAFVEGARKRPQEFRRRLNHLLKATAQGKTFGMVK